MRTACVAIALAGCSFTGKATPSDAGLVDDQLEDMTVDMSPIDAPDMAPDMSTITCYGTGSFQVCPLIPPSGSQMINGGTIKQAIISDGCIITDAHIERQGAECRRGDTL